MVAIAAPASVVPLSALSEVSISTPAAHEVPADSLKVIILSLILGFLYITVCNFQC